MRKNENGKIINFNNQAIELFRANRNEFVKKTITPFDDITYPKITDVSTLSFGIGLICNTQDKFEKRPAEINDMEAYSIAKVCKIYGFDFTSYKFISDNGDANDWKKNHNKGIELFLQKLKEDFKVS